MRKRRCIYGLAVLLGITALPGGGFGQERSEGRGYFMAGSQGMDLGSLNDRLQANGYGTFSETFGVFGGGGYAIVGRFVIGGEGGGVFGDSESATIGNDFFKSTLNGGYGLFRLGYIIARRGGAIVYPALGLGGGGLSLEISQEATLPFDQYLQNPRRSTRLGNGFLLLDLGVAAEHMVVLERRNGQEGGIMFGARIGYLFSPWRSDWGDALNGPDSGIEGVYFRLVFGGGGTQVKPPEQ